MHYGNHTFLQVHSTYDGNSVDSMHSDFLRDEAAQSSINYSSRQSFFFSFFFSLLFPETYS
jgi:hypothetical protein